MDLSHLRYFREIVRLSSMTAAARALGVSQPRLSVAVRNLEEHYATKLLLRHRGGVSPTESGLELLRHIDEVFEVLDRATARIAGLEGDLVGRFVLGCHESLGA
ncbi:MAG: LysR family transcriptional regulator, partial [Myxococcales bacterium]|nr:LysR family transcriptional regulator [Myxococcales bacterium]